MEAYRHKIMEENEKLRLKGGDSGIASVSPPRSTVRPLPRRNATPSQTSSRTAPSHAQDRPSHSAVVASSSSAPGLASAAPSMRAASPARIGPTSSTPRVTCRDWDMQRMLDAHRNFHPVRRISALAPPEDLLRELAEYEKSGEPLIIEDWHKHSKWNGDLLGIEWLLAHAGHKEIPVRNVHDRKDTVMTLAQFVERSRRQDVHRNPGESERLYWKDGECPSQWKDWLQDVLPAPILPGCRDDLLRHLLPSEAVETLLCYLGIGDTYTPAHKDLCASSGHNLMCFSENDGSSFWFMTKSAAAPQVAEYFQKGLGQELDWETHVTTLEEWGNAKFDVYVTEQKVGDLVLVPPRSVHQVVNRGGLAMKTSWSRMTLTNLKIAMRNELPIYRRVCRLEQYRVKTVLYRSLLHYTDELRAALEKAKVAPDSGSASSRSGLVDYGSSTDGREEDEGPLTQPPQTKEELCQTLFRLIRLFDDILLQEYAKGHNTFEHVTRTETSSRWPLLSADDTPSEHIRNVPSSPDVEKDSNDHKESYNLACDFCGADIFQSFFECRRCRADDAEEVQIGDGLLVCPTCYVEGRTCSCDDMEPRQCRPFDVLLQDRNEAASVLARVPLPLKNFDVVALPLKEKDLKNHDKIRVFEAACALCQLKSKCTAKELDNNRRCRPVGPSSADPKQNHKQTHDAKFITGLTCKKCHGFKCYAHLVHAGTHSAEALLAHRADELLYHDAHVANGLRVKKQPPVLYDVKGPDIKERLVVAAISFPRCKPGHSKLQLGWYDQELEAEPVNDVKTSQSVESSLQSIFREDSPLTPVSSPAKESDSPYSPVVHRASTTRPERTMSTDDDSVISLDYDSDDHRDSPVPDPQSASSIKPKQNRAYVELRSMASLRRTSSPVSVDLEPRRKKPRPNKMHEDGVGSTMSSTRAGSGAPAGQMVRGHVGKSYGTDLASALSQANATAPIFTQLTLPDRPRVQNRAGMRRIISPDPDGSMPPPVNHEASISHPRPSFGVSAAHKSAGQSREFGTHMLPASQNSADGSQDYPNPTLSTSISATSASSTSLKSTSAAELSRKRKRTGPPGVRQRDFEAHMRRLQHEPQAAEGARKKPRLRKKDADEEEQNEVEVSLLPGPEPMLTETTAIPSSTATQASILLSQHSLSSTPATASIAPVSIHQGSARQSSKSAQITCAPEEIPSTRGPSRAHPQCSPSHPQPSPSHTSPSHPPPPLPSLLQLSPSSLPQPPSAALPQHVPPSNSASTSPLMQDGLAAISNPLRALADLFDSNPTLLKPKISPELEQTMQHMKDEITRLRAELQTAQSRNVDLERRVKSLEDENTKHHEALQTERRERSLQAKIVRDLQTRTSGLESQKPPFDAVQGIVRETMMGLMPTLRTRLQELATQAVHDTMTNSVIVQEQRVTMTLHTDGMSPPQANVPFRQIEPANPIPQGPANFSDRPYNNRQYGGGGPQRGYGPRSQDGYQRNQDGREDGREDGRFRSSSRYQAQGPHGGNRDDDRSFPPWSSSSGGHGGPEGSRAPQNVNNWGRRYNPWSGNRSRGEASPHRQRSRSTDRSKDPVLSFDDNSTGCSEPVPRLRTADWEQRAPPTSSIGQFDDGDDMRAVGGSSTDPELSPIEDFPSSVKSRSNSKIQDSSFTERGDGDRDDKTRKPPTGPRENRPPTSSEERSRRQPTRPIRQ